MTVVYNSEVATVTFSGFLKLLIRWRGSIYKLLWKDFLLFAAIYTALAVIFQNMKDGDDKKRFQEMIEYCNKFQEKIPLSFILGFYVNTVIGRWWEQFSTIPWPSKLAVIVTSHIRGQDERSRIIRRTIFRYVCLGYVMTMSSISVPVKKRFPTTEHLVLAGFILPNEHKIVEELQTPYNKYYIPFIWAATLVGHARKEGRINNDFALLALLDEINAFRGKSQKLFNYDWVTIPLVYTQVATLAVYTFFLASLMGRQYIPETGAGDTLFPFFTMLQFFFYMGWLKVAEELMNPFGEDDDDFDINSLIDRNLRTGYLIVDEMHENVPELIKDQYWDTTEIQIPYTEAALEHRKQAPIGSAEYIEVPETQRQFLPEVPSVLSFIEEAEIESEIDLEEEADSKQGIQIYVDSIDVEKADRRKKGKSKVKPLDESELQIKESKEPQEKIVKDSEGKVESPANTFNPNSPDESELTLELQTSGTLDTEYDAPTATTILIAQKEEKLMAKPPAKEQDQHDLQPRITQSLINHFLSRLHEIRSFDSTGSWTLSDPSKHEDQGAFED